MGELLIISSLRPHEQAYHDPLLKAVRSLGYEPGVIHYKQTRQNMQRILNAQAVIIGGVPFDSPAETAEELAVELRSWVMTPGLPVLGICLGHQGLSLVAGATMVREQEVEQGICTLDIVNTARDNPLFEGLPDSIKVVSHHWASIKFAPDANLIRLGSSRIGPNSLHGCENQIVGVPDELKFGVQFHPELNRVGIKLLRNFLELSRARLTSASSVTEQLAVIN